LLSRLLWGELDVNTSVVDWVALAFLQPCVNGLQ